MKILIIQTAFIGDVILATALVESLRENYPGAELHFLLRKGNESLLTGHPGLQKVLIWDKKQGKYRNLIQLLGAVRRERYDLLVNCQRFAAAGILAAFSGARETVGFSKNPFSMFFSKRLPHHIGDGTHEVARNHSLIRHLCGARAGMPRLYPSAQDYEKARALAGGQRYVCIAPTSVWFTKQWPLHKWSGLMRQLPEDLSVFLLGGKADFDSCEQLRRSVDRMQVHNTAGQLSFLESAALIQGAAMNYVNDSGPMHLASALNAPVVAVFCSTVPDFGFGPLSSRSYVVETKENLSCRPCGLHGHKACPEGHFACAESIEIDTLDFKETA
jgi:heptosyltransferase-2